MESWILKGVKTLVNEPQSVSISSPTQVKVKVSHLLLTETDALLYEGKIFAKYPKILGRAAIGIVTEVGEKCYGIEKGMRVYLQPTRACGECLACKSGKSKECTSCISAGKDFDGFMRDFVVCEQEDVSPLPDSVDVNYALCIEKIGIAENTYDKLNLSAGQRVAVIGADLAGLLIAQVLLYHKVVPICIDNNPANLERAKKCGVYYAFPADDELKTNLVNATGGNMCDAAVYCATSPLPLSIVKDVIGDCKTVVLCFNSLMNASLSASDIISKNMTVTSVAYAYDYTNTVINMLVHNAVNLQPFEKEVLSEYDPVKILNEFCENRAKYQNKLTVFKMIL